MAAQQHGIRVAFAAVAIAAAAAAFAESKSHLQLVGELVGAVESPRIIQGFCASRQPKSASRYAKAYSEWRARHATIIEAVDAQVVRADARLQRERSPGADPAATTVTAITQILQRRLDTYTGEQIRQVCDAYPDMLKSKDKDMESAIPELLERVKAADIALTANEGRK